MPTIKLSTLIRAPRERVFHLARSIDPHQDSTGARRVLDLASGAGGPWFWLQPALAEQSVDVSVRLTDKYPNAGVLSQSRPNGDQPIRYDPQPVDAGRVPDELTGFRTLFSAFHHFRPGEAQGLLADAVRQREGIAVFEGTENRARSDTRPEGS
jgi:hypothetical protein